MITLDYIISDHKGAGRKAMQAICDYADLTGQIVFLNVDSHCPKFGLEGSAEKDAALEIFYEGYGFERTERTFTYDGVDYSGKDWVNMERQPNDSTATVRVRQQSIP